jgi:hypothetical protein
MDFSKFFASRPVLGTSFWGFNGMFLKTGMKIDGGIKGAPRNRVWEVPGGIGERVKGCQGWIQGSMIRFPL